MQDDKRALMPHLEHTPEELDQLYPPLVPPEDEQMDDLISDDHDAVYQKGLKLATGIQEETSAQGRRRRPLEAAGNGAAGTGDKGCTYRTKALRCQKDETAAAEVEHELDALSKEECLERAPLSTLLHLLDSSRLRLDGLPAELPEVRLRPPVLPSVRVTSGEVSKGPHPPSQRRTLGPACGRPVPPFKVNPSATLDGTSWLKRFESSRQ